VQDTVNKIPDNAPVTEKQSSINQIVQDTLSIHESE